MSNDALIEYLYEFLRYLDMDYNAIYSELVDDDIIEKFIETHPLPLRPVVDLA